jgi:hypothetical protein
MTKLQLKAGMILLSARHQSLIYLLYHGNVYTSQPYVLCEQPRLCLGWLKTGSASA